MTDEEFQAFQAEYCRNNDKLNLLPLSRARGTFDLRIDAATHMLAGKVELREALRAQQAINMRLVVAIERLCGLAGVDFSYGFEHEDAEGEVGSE